MRILVTGANGLLGQKLVELILAKGDYLIATAKSKPALPISNGEFHVMDVTNREQALEVISKTKPDAVIHTAAMTNVDQCEIEKEKCWLNNVTAVENVVEACSKNNCKLVHLSTDFIFDGTHGPLDEEAVPNPISYYGESKWAAEQVVQKSNIEWAIARTVLVFGVTKDMSRSNIVLWVKKSLEEGKTIQVVNDQWRTPTLAEDLAMGCYLVVTKNAIGIFNISGEEMMTPYDIAIATAEFFKLDKSLIKQTDSTKFTQTAKRPPKTGFLTLKAKEVLSYQPRSFNTALTYIKT